VRPGIGIPGCDSVGCAFDPNKPGSLYLLGNCSDCSAPPPWAPSGTGGYNWTGGGNPPWPGDPSTDPSRPAPIVLPPPTTIQTAAGPVPGAISLTAPLPMAIAPASAPPASSSSTLLLLGGFLVIGAVIFIIMRSKKQKKQRQALEAQLRAAEARTAAPATAPAARRKKHRS